MLHYFLWAFAFLLIGAGFVGTFVPILPGLPLIFIGAWIAAALDSYQVIGIPSLVCLGVLTVVGIVIDWLAQTVGAQKAGATKLGIAGSVIGTVLGIFSGLWGLLFFPVIGAFIGEFIDHQDAIRSGKVSIATTLGMLIGLAIKLGLAFAMLGILIFAWLF